LAGVAGSVLELVGRTPMLALGRLVDPGSAKVLAKLENLNPGGSVKDRIALAIVEDAEACGTLASGDSLVWATSGNSGVSLAMVAAAKGYRLTIFMPSNAPISQRRLLQRYGVNVQLTAPNLGMRGALEAAQNLADSADNTMLLDIFHNSQVVEAHYVHTAQEIIQDTNGVIDAFVAAVGTGGTIMGVGRRLKEVNPAVQIVAVEPAGSPVLSTGIPGRHMIAGIGADFAAPLYQAEIVDSIVGVTDNDAVQTALRLAREEGLLVGTSSGANVFAALLVARELGADKTVVTVLPDTGERYLDIPLG
jgi:cysteine synthase A